MLSNVAAENFLSLQETSSAHTFSPPSPPQTPVSNTGSNPQIENTLSGVYLGVHWLQGCGVYVPGAPSFNESQADKPVNERFTEMINFVCFIFNDVPIFDFAKGSYIGKYWQNTGRSPFGIKFAWSILEDGSLEYFLSIPGSVCESVPVRTLWAMLRSLVSANYFHCTRLDVALDDYDRSVSMQQVNDAAISNHFARFRSFRVITSGSLDSASVGQTIYFGSSQSDKMLRIYDKFVESGGKQNCIRWELQLRRESSHTFLSRWLYVQGSSNEQIDEFAQLSPSLLGGLVIGSIEFVYRTSEELSRCKKLDWWEEFQNKIGSSYRISIPKKITTLEDKVHWVFAQLAPTFAIFKKSFGVDSFYQLIESLILDGTSRLKEHHLALIRSTLLSKQLDQ